MTIAINSIALKTITRCEISTEKEYFIYMVLPLGKRIEMRGSECDVSYEMPLSTHLSFLLSPA